MSTHRVPGGVQAARSSTLVRQTFPSPSLPSSPGAQRSVHKPQKGEALLQVNTLTLMRDALDWIAVVPWSRQDFQLHRSNRVGRLIRPGRLWADHIVSCRAAWRQEAGEVAVVPKHNSRG